MLVVIHQYFTDDCTYCDDVFTPCEAESLESAIVEFSELNKKYYKDYVWFSYGESSFCPSAPEHEIQVLSLEEWRNRFRSTR